MENKMVMGKKIGIMGGTFNPIHLGHLVMAEQAYEQFSLDNVMFLPSKKPPHKKYSEIVSENHRTNMILKAIDGNAHFFLSTMELDREGVTYTIDTMKQLKKENPQNQYSFIIGADSLFQLQEWNRAEELMGMTEFLVATRDHHTYEEMGSYVRKLEEKYKARVQFIKIPTIEISSSDIRERIKQGKSIKYLVSEQVEEYIKEHNIYEPV